MPVLGDRIKTFIGLTALSLALNGCQNGAERTAVSPEKPPTPPSVTKPKPEDLFEEKPVLTIGPNRTTLDLIYKPFAFRNEEVTFKASIGKEGTILVTIARAPKLSERDRLIYGAYQLGYDRQADVWSSTLTKPNEDESHKLRASVQGEMFTEVTFDNQPLPLQRRNPSN